MCKILYLLTQIAKRSIWMRDYEYPNVLSLGVGGGTLGTVDRGRAGYILRILLKNVLYWYIGSLYQYSA